MFCVFIQHQDFSQEIACRRLSSRGRRKFLARNYSVYFGGKSKEKTKFNIKTDEWWRLLDLDTRLHGNDTERIKNDNTEYEKIKFYKFAETSSFTL